MIRRILRIEGLFLFLGSLFLYALVYGNWLMFILLILTPDISMIGYLKNKKVGALTYNLVHNYALAVILIVIGYFFNMQHVLIYGIIVGAHISMDRMLGIGIKLTSGFKDTHLGKIGR